MSPSDAVLPKTDSHTKPKRQPPYAVILLNDDLHSFQFVMEALQQVFGYPEAKCFRLTETAHHTGRAVVWAGALEVAELKADQLKACGPDKYAAEPVPFPLGVELEPLPGE